MHDSMHGLSRQQTQIIPDPFPTALFVHKQTRITTEDSHGNFQQEYQSREFAAGEYNTITQTNGGLMATKWGKKFNLQLL